MQTLIQVICSEGESLRDEITKDEKLAKHNLYVEAKRKTGRSPSWTKHRSLDLEVTDVINITWQGCVKILTCRVVTEGTGKPGVIIGDFVNYLLDCFSGRIESIIVLER